MLGHSFPDRFVKRDDSGMFGFAFSCELLKDVALIQFEFLSSVGEGEQVGIANEVECDSPVPMCSDRFRCIFRTEFEFDLSNGFCALIIGGSGIESGEDVVKVDDFSLNEVKPFGVRESWTSRSVDDARFNLFGIG